MTQTAENRDATLRAAFGYNPREQLGFIGTFRTRTGRALDFYFNRESGRIDVCNQGCNGTSWRGTLGSDGNSGLPEEIHEAFLRLRESIGRRVHIGVVHNLKFGQFKTPMDFFCYFDAVDGTIDISWVPVADGYRGYWKDAILPASDNNSRRTSISHLLLEKAFLRVLEGWKAAGGKEPFHLDWASIELTQEEQSEIFFQDNPYWWLS